MPGPDELAPRSESSGKGRRDRWRWRRAEWWLWWSRERRAAAVEVWRKKSAERTGGVALLDLLGFAFHDYFNSPFTFLPPAFSFISFSFLLSNSLSPLSLYLSLSPEDVVGRSRAISAGGHRVRFLPLHGVEYVFFLPFSSFLLENHGRVCWVRRHVCWQKQSVRQWRSVSPFD